jgi:Fe-S-cluster-containing hydrogenase component 2
MKRRIVEIDDEKCNGCGKCIPNCHEGALRIVEGKARLVGDSHCDGLGACIGTCPHGAIRIVEREAAPYNERKVMGEMAKRGAAVMKAHLEHLQEHGEEAYLKEALGYLKEKGVENPLPAPSPSACCASRTSLPPTATATGRKNGQPAFPVSGEKSGLRQWPIKLALVPPNAPYFDNPRLLMAADCVPFAHAEFHRDFLRGAPLAIACPKLGESEFYEKKLAEIIEANSIREITILHMEVPCCFGLRRIAEEAARRAGRKIRLTQRIVSVHGGMKQ